MENSEESKKKKCRTCGVQVEKPRWRFCSDQCFAAAYPKSKQGRPVECGPCPYCGKKWANPMRCGPDPTYCSRKCKSYHNRQYTPRKTCSVCGGPKQPGHGQVCSLRCGKTRMHIQREKQKAKRKGLRYERVCSVCGAGFSSATKRSRFCSACRPFSTKLALSKFGERECGICLARFTPGLNTTANFCSLRCARESRRQRNIESSAKRRALIRGAFVEKVDPVHVFVRDGWICRACGVKTSRSGGTTDPKYPNLDHVIPLSKGGTHSLDNCQLLCRKCNSEKRNRLEAV